MPSSTLLPIAVACYAGGLTLALLPRTLTRGAGRWAVEDAGAWQRLSDAEGDEGDVEGDGRLNVT